MTEQKYVGEELTIFAHAVNWKAYYGKLIRPYFGDRVLEAGAGLGGTTLSLCPPDQREWVCLEPDPTLLREIDQLIAGNKLPGGVKTRPGFVQDLPADDLYDCIIYIDVIEHIEDDAAELARAAEHLKPGGFLVALSPAHQWLFTPFDEAIGHYRRYNRIRMEQVTPPGCDIERIFYLDSAGMLLSAANRLMLRQSMPTVNQILVWDRLVIPVSRLLDWLTGYRFGKSVVGVWRKR